MDPIIIRPATFGDCSQYTIVFGALRIRVGLQVGFFVVHRALVQVRKIVEHSDAQPGQIIENVSETLTRFVDEMKWCHSGSVE